MADKAHDRSFGTAPPCWCVVREGAWLASLLLLSLPVGAVCHEVLGHGLAAIALGGRVTRLEVLGFQVWPRIRWVGWQGRYGWCDYDGVEDARADAWVGLAGSGSTFVVAVLATVALWFARRVWLRRILIVLSLWWIDLLTYLLPVFGLKRSILWGARYSEPYEAAVALGVPGALFVLLAFTGCAVLGAVTVCAVRRVRLG